MSKEKNEERKEKKEGRRRTKECEQSIQLRERASTRNRSFLPLLLQFGSALRRLLSSPLSAFQFTLFNLFSVSSRDRRLYELNASIHHRSTMLMGPKNEQNSRSPSPVDMTNDLLIQDPILPHRKRIRKDTFPASSYQPVSSPVLDGNPFNQVNIFFVFFAQRFTP